jgi:hypothetical protein
VRKNALYPPLIAMAMLPTTGCSAEATSAQAVREALDACGIEEDELLWMVDDRGTFLFGGPAADAPLNEEKERCLELWIDRANVRVGSIGYEASR